MKFKVGDVISWGGDVSGELKQWRVVSVSQECRFYCCINNNKPSDIKIIRFQMSPKYKRINEQIEKIKSQVPAEIN